MRWPPWRRAPDTSEEAGEHLAKLEKLDGQVAELGRELRATQRRNNFSGMVAAAITGRPQEGPRE